MLKEIRIKDCTAKETAIIQRWDGDIRIDIVKDDEEGKPYIAFTFVVEMKKPYKPNFQKIMLLIKQIKQLLVQREPKK